MLTTEPMKLYALLLGSLFLSNRPPPAAKWVGPVFALPGGGQAQTTIYYGPWQCRKVWLDACHAKCAAEARKSMGCIWLADVKGRVESRLWGLPAINMGGTGRRHALLL